MEVKIPNAFDLLEYMRGYVQRIFSQLRLSFGSHDKPWVCCGLISEKRLFFLYVKEALSACKETQPACNKKMAAICCLRKLVKNQRENTHDEPVNQHRSIRSRQAFIWRASD
jgi:hypothetical protein